MGRLSWASLTVPATPPLDCRALSPAPAGAAQLGRDKHQLLTPHCPCPESWSLPAGHDTPKGAGPALQGRTPRTEHTTELLWQCWANREHSKEEEEARKAHFPRQLCLQFTAPPSQPDPLGFTSNFHHPEAVTFPQTLWAAQPHLPVSPLCSLLAWTLHSELWHWLGTCRYPKPFISSNPVKVLQKRSPEWGLASAGP